MTAEAFTTETHTFRLADGSTITREVRVYPRCIDARKGDCDGETHGRVALSGSGIITERCEHHYAAYVERTAPKLEAIRHRYPDSDIPPNWFDPTYAGESWNDD